METVNAKAEVKELSLVFSYRCPRTLKGKGKTARMSTMAIVGQ